MYSDLLESPSKGCFSFNDPFPLNDLTEMDDYTNQTNLDLIFDTYYSTRVSQCGTGFELPEDCKNMSFSELFGQELLSTEENKDCKITINIEKNDSLDTNSHSLINSEENISLSSSLSKSLISKKGINRTLIKSTDNCDVRHLMNYPFCIEDLTDNQILTKPKIPVTKQELKITNNIIDKNTLEVDTLSRSYASDFSNTTSSSPLKHRSINRKKSTNNKCDIENFCQNSFRGSDNQLPMIKMPPKNYELDYVNDIAEQNIVEMRLTPSNSVNASQSKIDEPGFVKFEEVMCSPLKTTSNYHDVARAYVKLTDVKDLICKSSHSKNNVKDNQMPVDTERCKPVSAHKNIVKTEIITCYPANDSNFITDCHNSVKVQIVEKDHLSSQSDYVIQKLRKNKATVKPTKHCFIKHIVHKPFTEPSLVKAKTSNIKNECVDFNLDHTPVSNVVSVNPKNIKNSNKIVKGHKKLMNKPYDKTHNLGIKKNDIESSLLKNSSAKLHGINRNCIKITENHDDQKLTHKHGLKSKNPTIEQSLKTKTSIPELKPRVINDVNKKNIVKSVVVSCNSSDNICKKGDNIFKSKKDLFTALSESVIPKRQGVRRTIKAVDSHDKQQVNKSAYEVKGTINGVTKVIKSKPEDQGVKSIVERTLGETKMINGESKCVVDSNDFCSNGIDNTNIESQEVVVVKEHNETSLKNDTTLQNITVDNEKKKITWDEFRAKREKMGFLSIPANNEDPSKDKTDIGELESILEEFDRNTAMHFINQNSKVDDTEEQNISAVEEINEVEDLELQNKRMKIEYFQKLLPTSFASEIAKTSSLMKGILVEDNEIDSTASDLVVSNGKTQSNSCNTKEDLVLKQDDKIVKKNNQTRINNLSHCITSRSDYSTKNGRSSMLSKSDNHHHRNRIDAAQHVGQYGKNLRNPFKRAKDQKRVVYVGQIPIRFGKSYLVNRFNKFGTIQSITLHNKPDFRVYYAFVTYSNQSEAERAINHGNDDKSQVQLDIRFGERKQTQTPYYDLDDEWLTDWYGYNNQPLAVVRPPQNPRKVSFEQELQEFYKLAQIKKTNHKSSQIS